jgi:hypothetical protein
MILALQELEAQEGVKVELPYSLDRSDDEEKAHLPEQIQFLWDYRPAYIDQPIHVPRPVLVRLNELRIKVELCKPRNWTGLEGRPKESWEVTNFAAKEGSNIAEWTREALSKVRR